jgi:hypothetical protein
MSKMRNNPRIIMAVKNESTTCKGVYIDHKGDEYGFNRSFNSEAQAMDYLSTMREFHNCEFSVQINRINWSK